MLLPCFGACVRLRYIIRNKNAFDFFPSLRFRSVFVLSTPTSASMTSSIAKKNNNNRNVWARRPIRSEREEKKQCTRCTTNGRSTKRKRKQNTINRFINNSTAGITWEWVCRCICCQSNTNPEPLRECMCVQFECMRVYEVSVICSFSGKTILPISCRVLRYFGRLATTKQPYALQSFTILNCTCVCTFMLLCIHADASYLYCTHWAPRPNSHEAKERVREIQMK